MSSIVKYNYNNSKKGLTLFVTEKLIKTLWFENFDFDSCQLTQPVVQSPFVSTDVFGTFGTF